MNFVEFVSTKAHQCDWKVSNVISENLVAITFSAGSGNETCFIRPCGKNNDGNTILEFSSMGLPLPDDPQVAGELALVLLERNGNMLMGNWGIEEVGEGKVFTVFVSMIANTMDVDEFKAAVTAVIAERERIFKAVQKTSIDF
jgi:hypothetical protein